MSMPAPTLRPSRIVLFSSLYPSSVRPGHGIFVETRLRQLLAAGAVQARVVAPVPWFYSTDERHGEHALMARTPAQERWHGIDVAHPRYLLPPKVGMNVAPFVMALGAAPALRRLVEQGFDFDAIDAHYYYPDGVAAALLARHFDRPFVVTARGSDINLIGGYALPRRLMRWAAARATASIAVSAALAEAMTQLGIEGARVLRNGVDLERFVALPQGPSRRQLGWPDAPTLIAVGNLVQNKGQHLAIEALAALPQWRLHLVGEGPQAAALRALAVRLGVADRVLFCGRVEPERLSEHYSAADILVLPSEREGAPNVVLEALACGVGVVASAVGGIPEVIDSPALGRLVEPRSAPALAAAVRELWAQGIDRAALRRHAQHFGWDATTREQQALFGRLAQARRPGSADPRVEGARDNGVELS
jgi:teichuronic acid biosynthesis glycosyltransferase TuaC